jgi:hypothetical protein
MQSSIKIILRGIFTFFACFYTKARNACRLTPAKIASNIYCVEAFDHSDQNWIDYNSVVEVSRSKWSEVFNTASDNFLTITFEELITVEINIQNIPCIFISPKIFFMAKLC